MGALSAGIVLLHFIRAVSWRGSQIKKAENGFFALHHNNASSTKGQLWMGFFFFLFFYIQKQLCLNLASQKISILDKNVLLTWKTASMTWGTWTWIYLYCKQRMVLSFKNWIHSPPKKKGGIRGVLQHSLVVSCLKAKGKQSKFLLSRLITNMCQDT